MVGGVGEICADAAGRDRHCASLGGREEVAPRSAGAEEKKLRSASLVRGRVVEVGGVVKFVDARGGTCTALRWWRKGNCTRLRLRGEGTHLF